MLLAFALVATVVVSGVLSARASGATKCERFAQASVQRSKAVTGAGERVVVVGDSWSAGLGLARPAQSWPSRLAGQVHVAGFSGSGFSAGASECGRSVSFAAREPRALSDGADLVVLEGGLNDVDQTSAAITAGFRRALAAAAPHPVVVVGPATAPSRARWVPRVDALLARLSAEAGVPYVATSDLRLTYLPDRLHLTPAGHRAFGDAVAQRIAALGL
jgi:acyl-CoA thioesterase-1